MSQVTLDDVFEIPSGISALDFVIQIDEGEHSPQRLVDSYVLTPGVQDDLRAVLTRMKAELKQGKGVGWFIHGSFGSGKSHFMGYLSYLLENSDVAWQKDHPFVGELRSQFRPWVAERELLVVRVNLMSAARQSDRFDRLVYEAVNRELDKRGKPLFEFIDVDGVLQQAQREGQRYGEAFWKGMESVGVPDAQEVLEHLLGSQDIKPREKFALAYLEYKGMSAEQAGINPAWAEGLRRLATHLKQQGFDGLVLMLDEMLLWLSGKDDHDFKAAINQLNVMVDFSGGPRDIPLAVLMARQRRFSDFFPDMSDNEELHEHLDHHRERFELITLEDVELRHIVRERVLKVKDPDKLAPVLDALTERHSKLLPTILQSGDEDYLRDVYPYHPALIEMLIDVSSLLQRDRTALRLLYQLLIASRDLPLGELVPVGSAFDFIFPTDNFIGYRRVTTLQAINNLYHQRIGPAIASMAADENLGSIDERRAHTLAQLVKTSLLGKVSPRLSSGFADLSVDRLVRFNDVEVQGRTDLGRMSVTAGDLLELSRRIPAVQISGSGGNAVVSITIEGPDFGELLERAKSSVDNLQRRFHTFYSVFKQQLGIAGQSGFGPQDNNDGPLRVNWRNTERRGSLCIGNIRAMPYERFRPGSAEFRIVIDYPWDEAGFSVEDDRLRVPTVRKAEGSLYTICWLPRHFTPHELDLITDLAACELIASPEGRKSLMPNRDPSDQLQLVDRAEKRAATLRAQLQEAIKSAYRDRGEIIAMVGDVEESIPKPELSDNLEHFARSLLDRRYPQHPSFKSRPTTGDLETLLGWMLQASETESARAPFDDKTERVLRDLGEPLEVVKLGQTHGQLRQDTRYIQHVLQPLGEASLLWAPIDNALTEEYGLQPALRNLFLFFVLRSRSYRTLAEKTGDPIDPGKLDNNARVGLLLERAPVLEAAEWSRARNLGAVLFGLEEPTAYRTLGIQDAWGGQIREAGHLARQQLRSLHSLLVRLGGSEQTPRLSELRQAIDRLQPVDDTKLDSYHMLAALVSAWPDDIDDPLRGVTRGAEADLELVKRVDEDDLGYLRRALGNPVLGKEIQHHVEKLQHWLEPERQHSTLTGAKIHDWNEHAADLVRKLITVKPDPDPDPDPDPEPPRDFEEVFHERDKPIDPREVDTFISKLRSQIAQAAQGAAELRIDITLRRKPEDDAGA